MSTKKKPAKPAAKSSVEYNPFQIVNNVELKSNKVPNPLAIKLAEQMLKLKVKDNMNSVFVSLTVANTKNDAQNLILAAKRYLNDTHPNAEYSFSSRFNHEGQVSTGNYLGANVWRTN